jgi:tryptophan synthase alpha chain
MNRINQTFANLRERRQTALMPFIMVGDPDLDTSLDIVKCLAAAGADMIELGVPYSDPLADGPVIQRSSERALENQVRITDVIRLAKRAREEGVDIPFILFSYYNPVLRIGVETVMNMLVEHDISGIIIPDLPIEEDAEVRAAAEARGIHLIPLVAPTSEQRIQLIAGRARGFVYCVSSLGVTGERSHFMDTVDQFIATVRDASRVPVCVGFGISNRAQVERFSKVSDGVIVGSAIVRKIEESLPLLRNPDTRQQGLSQIGQFVAQLKG